MISYPLLTLPLPTIGMHLANMLTVQMPELQCLQRTSLLQYFSDWTVHESNCTPDLIACGAVREIRTMLC